MLARVGLASRAAAPSSQLSEGDLKRLEMARAIATDPLLLLLDEPVAGLSQGETGCCRTPSASSAPTGRH